MIEIERMENEDVTLGAKWINVILDGTISERRDPRQASKYTKFEEILELLD